MVNGQKVMILNLPSPAGMDVNRDYSGGFGNARLVRRKDYGHSGDVLFGVFMPYLATGLNEAGHNLEVLDGQVERLNLDGIIAAIGNSKPGIVVSMLSLPSLYGDIQLLNRIKEQFPETVLVVLGVTARVLADEVLGQSKIDYIVDGEYPFYSYGVVSLIRALQDGSKNSLREVPGLIFRDNRDAQNVISVNQLGASRTEQSLDNLDLESYRTLPVSGYRLCFFSPEGRPLNYFPILSAKGCPFPCIYCPYPVGFGKKISFKSPVKIIDEMEYLSENFAVRAFLFRDQVFTASQQRIEEICDLLLERKLRVNWLFETRVDRISKKLLEKMKQAGCNRIHYGIETGDDELLDKIGKPGVDRQMIKEVFRITKEQGIYTMAHVILGLPGENFKTAKHTFELLSDIRPDGVNWSLITPYPGTKLFEMAKEKGLILTYDWQKYNTEQVVMRTEELTGEQLGRLSKKFSRAFRIKQVLTRLRRAVYDKRDLNFLLRRAFYEFRTKAMSKLAPGT